MHSEAAINTKLASVRAKNRVPVWVMPAIKAAILVADALIAALSFMLAFKLREGSPILSSTAWAWSQQFVPYAGIVYFVMIVRVLMLLYRGVFRFQGAFTYTQEAIRIFKAVLSGTLLVIAWAFLFRGGFAFREFSYSRMVFVLDFAIALTAYLLFHLLLRYLQVRARNRDINLIPTLIVGTNPEAEQTIAELQERRDLGYRVIGVIAIRGDSDHSEFESRVGLNLVGRFSELPEVVRELAIQEVIITDHTLSSDDLFESMMKIGRKQRVEFRFAPSLFDLLPQKTSVDQIGVLPMVRLFREPLSDVDRFLKRLSDIVISVAASVLLFPVLLAAAIWVKLDSRGSVLFRQERVGMDGRIFLCYKFRSMTSDADESVHREAYRKNIEGDHEANAGDELKPVFGKVKNDPRITRAGSFLRRSSIDELPQLINVIKGDMSIVGPRPPIPYEVEEYEAWHRKRLDMKPGITGLWQVSGRNRLTFEEMVRADLFYIENWSLWLDLKVILLTIPAVLRGDGAR